MFRLFKKVTLDSKSLNKLIDLNTRCLATQAVAKSAAVPKSKADKSSNLKSQSFTMNIFRGELQANQIFPYPECLSEEQQETVKMMIDPVETFFNEVNDPFKNDETSSIDEKTQKALWELGAFALQVSQTHGGLGLNNTQYARLVEIVGHNDLGVSITLGAHQSIGFKGILLFGTKEQKEKYLPRVCNGEFAAFCLTEPSCGSDAGAVRTKAQKSADGSHYILNGNKIWISNGGLADIMTVFAKLPVTDPITGETKDKVTAFIVERSFGGVTSGKPENKMGIKCSNTTEVFYENVKVPAENLLGEEGQGFKVAMQILNNGRFGMSACLSGTMQYCIQKATEHAKQRVQFGRTIDSYGTIQEKLARMSLLQYVSQSIAYMVSGNMDLGSQDYHLEAAISKIFASESAWFVCDEAIQILGGMGYMKGTGLEKVLRDLRIFRIFEGTNDILRLFVALTGIQYAGSHLKELQDAFKNPTANLGLIAEEVSKRAYKAIGMNSLNMAQFVHPNLAASANLCAKSIEMFGSTIEYALVKYGRKIVDEQFVLNRIAQAAIDTYTMAVVLSRASFSAKKNNPSSEHEILMAQTWCSEASSRVAFNLKTVKDAKSLEIFSKLSKISKNVCDAKGVLQKTPLGY
ncbi:very long-chain specific acyl-CoA dehydrogenase, mitochondrial-like [Phymastichus coffea]|uniref:very long-chain specific acyl-CoA dehydrogenase, mitochondrial-like n=1 Tax=Phymastichus coffea TaxID=108790 RepID=UPI00273CC855|nr:very long-chain specific acyl-CoA dehydrogenase, mitochondrial-like [Phymastichus coffea]